MNLLDYIIIAILIFFTVKGILMGFIREIASLAGIILGFWLGIKYIPEVTQFLSGYVPESRFLPFLSFATVFVGVLVLCNITGWILYYFLRGLFLYVLYFIYLLALQSIKKEMIFMDGFTKVLIVVSLLGTGFCLYAKHINPEILNKILGG